VRDPSLKRTRQEIEVAMSNALLAREVVFELFQDLDTFNLSDFQEFDDQGRGMQRLLTFAQRAAHLEGSELRPDGEDIYELIRPSQPTLLFTTERNKALAVEELNLLGLEHPMIKAWMEQATSLRHHSRPRWADSAANSPLGTDANRGTLRASRTLITKPTKNRGRKRHKHHQPRKPIRTRDSNRRRTTAPPTHLQWRLARGCLLLITLAGLLRSTEVK
jgi:hypothetical protein